MARSSEAVQVREEWTSRRRKKRWYGSENNRMEKEAELSVFSRNRSEHGAVTVFFIVIFAAVFAFVALFIDFARMFALQAQVETLVHAASRSVLSAYDRELAERYGLFAYGQTDGNYIMSKVLQDQFELVRQKEGFPLLNARLDSSAVEFMHPIGTYPVFEQQIREQMKYRAPIDITIELLNRFKPMAGVMKEASNTVDLLGKLQKLYDQREAKLDQLLELQRQAGKTVEPYAKALSGGGGSDSLSTLADAAAEYPEFVSQVEADAGLEPEDRMYTAQISRYRSATSGLFAALDRALRTAEQKHAAVLPQAKSLLDEARRINEQMRQTIAEAENRPEQAAYNEVSAGTSTRSGSSDPVGEGAAIEEIRAQADSLLLSDELFASLGSDMDRQTTAFAELRSAGNTLLAQSGSVLSATAPPSSFASSVNSAVRASDAYLRQFVTSGSGNILEASARRLDAHRSSDKERKATEKAASATLKDAASRIRKIEQLKNGLKEHQAQFDQLKAKMEANRSLNRSVAGEEAGATSVNDDPSEAGRASMGMMDNIYGGLASLMGGMSDNVYQTEYVASYFHFLDVSVLNGLFEGKNQADALEAIRGQLAPESQEVEYILYGAHHPAGNIAAAFGEIFAMRLAIRTMEGLVKNAAKGNPLLVFAAALLYGAQHALQDMISLTRDGKIQLSDYLKVDLTYRDHLRLFLLLHGRSEQRLSRMLAMIALNTGVDPAERSTYVKGNVTVAMPLWFLPGVSKALGKVGILKGHVEGSQYYVAKQADFSY
ncbi:TadE/TadG family type IV pilus assembly protein [Paenibacillus barengoltzii]|uniref:TadE/TadG family type IV pilus assembly protein n=1 Tax=Paenibacillus barengoltzii TaxID=343517 RepID=UPI0020FFFD5D|nr:TadE family protein [Paenibacillus barengoltzii]